MGLKEMLMGTDIHAGLEEYRNTPGAVLVDVRTPEEYAQGHLPGSVNIPIQRIFQVEQLVADKQTPLFVYCLSGARSRRAAAFFEKLDYLHVRNIGGISGYRGELAHS